MVEIEKKKKELKLKQQRMYFTMLVGSHWKEKKSNESNVVSNCNPTFVFCYREQ